MFLFFLLLSKHMRKMTHGMLVFMADVFIYLSVVCMSLSKTKVWPGIVFYYSNCHENLYRANLTKECITIG